MTNEEKREEAPEDSKEILGLPGELLSGAMLPFLSQQDLLTFSRVGKFGLQFREEPDTWAMRIQNEFQCNVGEIIPESRRALLLPNNLIYQHLKIYKEIDSLDLRLFRFTQDDPAIFQRALSPEITQSYVLTRYLDKAARVGNFELVQWLVAPARGARRVDPSNDTTLTAAIRSGNLELVQWLMAQTPWLPPDICAVENAAGKGYMELVQWLMHQDRGWRRVTFYFPKYLLDRAARSGKIEFVRWLMAEEKGKKPIQPTPSALADAALYNRRELIEWWMDEKRGSQRVTPDYAALNAAAGQGNLALVQWFMSENRGTQRVQFDRNTFYYAAGSGNFDLVLWLVAQGAEPCFASLSAAVNSGNLDLVKWLMSSDRGERQQNPTDHTLELAAKYGHLAIMQWLSHEDRGVQCVLPTRGTLNWALKYGQLNIVQYLMTAQEDTPPIFTPDEDTLRLAIESHNLALVRWLLEERVVIPTVAELNTAASAGDLEIVQWLMAAERGQLQVMPNLNTLHAAAERGDLEIIEWLMADERGAQQVNPNHITFNHAVYGGNYKIVTWLADPARGQQQIRPNADELQEDIWTAVSQGHPALVNWLRSLLPPRLDRGIDPGIHKNHPYLTRLAVGTVAGLAVPSLIYIGFMAAGKTEDFAKLFNSGGGIEGMLGLGAGIGFIIGILAAAKTYFRDSPGVITNEVIHSP